MSGAREFQYIDKASQLEDYCHSISDARVIAFDTEFVSEDCYQPELCLIQVAAAGQFAVIDAIELADTQPFWELLVRGGHETVVHAAREEFRFCQHFTGRRPARLFDTQVAAGLVGMEFPAALSTLANKFLWYLTSKKRKRAQIGGDDR